MARMEPGRPMGGSNVVGSPAVEESQPVPEAVPRRRISFRGDADKPSPPVAAKTPRQEPAATEPSQEPVETPVEVEQPDASVDAPMEAAESTGPVEAGDVRGGEESQ